MSFSVKSLKTRVRRWLQRDYKRSFAQCGEDLISDFVLSSLMPTVQYLDVGAHHPVHFSNTYYFYCKGAQGVCVEPDPDLFRSIQRKRSRDLCLNAGVGLTGSGTAPFYVMSNRTLNTFSAAEAKRFETMGSNRIERTINIPLLMINDIMEKHFQNGPDFLSLDIEGLELPVLRTMDFSRFRPKVMCIETITYSEDNTERKLTETIDFVLSQGYLIFADTYINTIFVDEEFWRNRKP